MATSIREGIAVFISFIIIGGIIFFMFILPVISALSNTSSQTELDRLNDGTQLTPSQQKEVDRWEREQEDAYQKMLDDAREDARLDYEMCMKYHLGQC